MHPYYIKLKIGWEANLLLSSKNVVVGSPKNVVGGLRSDQKNVVVRAQNVVENVVVGIETQWAALYAARQMIHEESLCIVLIFQNFLYIESFLIFDRLLLFAILSLARVTVSSAGTTNGSHVFSILTHRFSSGTCHPSPCLWIGTRKAATTRLVGVHNVVM